MIPLMVFNGLSLSKLHMFNNCNTATCVPTKCNARYCSSDVCVENPIKSCCEDENCDDVEKENYSFNTLHTLYINATKNTTLGTIANDILFRNGSIAGACLISDSTCSGTLGPTNTDKIVASIVNSLNSTHCLIINNKMTVCPDGNVTLLNGTFIANRINVSNLVCLDRALPYSGGFIDINGATLGNAGFNASGLVVTGNLTVNTVQQQIRPQQVILAGVLVTNNSIQGFKDNTFSKLLLNPNSGNVGFSIVSNDTNEAIYTAQSGGGTYVTSGVYFDKATADNGAQGTAFNTYIQEAVDIAFTGPWPTNSNLFRFWTTRIQNVVTISMESDIINNCSGVAAPMISTGGTFDPRVFPSGTSPVDVRMRVINNSVEVDGVMRISYTNVTISTTALNGSGLGYINGTTLNFCGALKTSITYVL
jgi:hypothetical protein